MPTFTQARDRSPKMENKLPEMGLTKRDVTDEPLRFAHWQRKKSIETAVKATDSNLAAYNELWRTSNTNPRENEVSCKIPVHAARVSAFVTAGEADGVTDKNIPEKI